MLYFLYIRVKAIWGRLKIIYIFMDGEDMDTKSGKKKKEDKFKFVTLDELNSMEKKDDTVASSKDEKIEMVEPVKIEKESEKKSNPNKKNDVQKEKQSKKDEAELPLIDMPAQETLGDVNSLDFVEDETLEVEHETRPKSKFYFGFEARIASMVVAILVLFLELVIYF